MTVSVMRSAASIDLSNIRLIKLVDKLLNGEHTHVINSHSTFSVTGTVVEDEVAIAA